MLYRAVLQFEMCRFLLLPLLVFPLNEFKNFRGQLNEQERMYVALPLPELSYNLHFSEVLHLHCNMCVGNVSIELLTLTSVYPLAKSKCL